MKFGSPRRLKDWINKIAKGNNLISKNVWGNAW